MKYILILINTIKYWYNKRGKYNTLSKQELMNGIPQKKKIKEQDVRELATEIFEYNIYSSKGVKEVLN